MLKEWQMINIIVFGSINKQVYNSFYEVILDCDDSNNKCDVFKCAKRDDATEWNMNDEIAFCFIIGTNQDI